MAGEPTKPNSQSEVPSRKDGSVPEGRSSSSADIAAFVAKARAMSPHAAGARGRLVFALDATMSRQPTWDMACTLQADMFREAAALGSLDIRLVYYRGLNECRATGWISDSAQLAKLMSKIDCQGGNTQIGKVLSEARREAVASAVRAVVFVGDAMQSGVQAIASAYGDYAKKSFEDTKSFVEKLSGVKSLDKALEAQTEFARSSYETFVAESQKIAGLYTDLAKQTFKPYEGLVAKLTPAAH